MTSKCGVWGRERTESLFHNFTSPRCPESSPPLPVRVLPGLEVHYDKSLAGHSTGGKAGETGEGGMKGEIEKGERRVMMEMEGRKE